MKKTKWLSLILGISVMLTACSNSSGGGSGSGGGDDGSGKSSMKTSEPSSRDKLLNVTDEIEVEIDQVYDTSSYKGKKAFLVVTNFSNETQKVFKQQSSSINQSIARNIKNVVAKMHNAMSPI